jgi:hypothetical protein
MIVIPLHWENFLRCWLPERGPGGTDCQRFEEAGEEV